MLNKLSGIAKGISSMAGAATINGAARLGFTGAAVVGQAKAVAGIAGALTLHSVGHSLDNSAARAQRQQNAFTKETFRESGWMRRQSMLFTTGLTNNGLSGGFGAMGSYAVGRTKDTIKSFAQPHIGVGAGVGAGIGLLTGVAAASFTKQPGAVAFMAGAGALAGAYTARKVGLQIQEGVNLAKRNTLNRPRFSNRSRGGGAGFNSWTNAKRMGRPGHLGMDGSVPLALHKTRRRSTV
ncbi:hypothetical protein H8D85_00765 [bacterium]|nr:hypothetical protein [bacterium]